MDNPSREELENLKETARWAGALAAVCQLVARLLREKLDAETAERLCAINASPDQGDFILGNKACADGLSTMQGFFVGNDKSLRLRQASDDFHDLFVGPHKLLAPPWSSVYLDEGGVLFGPTSLEVRRIYAARGYAIPEGAAEPADHAAYEWQFLANLQDKVMAAGETGDEGGSRGSMREAEDFFKGFIAPWMSAFCDRMVEGARTDFYRGLAEFAKGLLSLEAELFDKGEGGQ